MNFKKLKESAKSLPYPVYVAGLLLPGGLCAIALYLAWKSYRKQEQPLSDFVKEMVEKETKND